ncbi:signal peptide peptidase [Raphidocelis subcapitata]|uniref:Signal peptide peptidase n=1 Tax=Raphidocelis subcapitata TaxID=307507 RepID=A0A2V0P7Z7_9CHLO|nr:signal peptide peptidase [Raphidocelis subcapitata]|eukprot:GBF93215.1 signal peptide peptidase [Raphidocelis subcapitata]
MAQLLPRTAAGALPGLRQPMRPRVALAAARRAAQPRRSPRPARAGGGGGGGGDAEGRPAADAPAAAAAAAASGLIAAPPSAAQWRWEASDDALSAYAALAAVLAIGALPQLHSQPWADLPYFIALAVTTIYIGSHRAVTSTTRQQISFKEGLLAPIVLSASLFGLYLVLRYTDFDLQTLLTGYFWLLTATAVAGAGGPMLRRAGDAVRQPVAEFEVPEGLLLDESGATVTRASLRPSDAAAVALGVGIATLGVHSPSFTLNNMVACLVATELLQLLGIRSFRAAALLLTGLLAYDAFWVFASPSVIGENVMLAVATSDQVTGPTRLLFPRIPGGGGEAADFPFSLLGLGDVCLPGLLAALALRYDATRSTDMRARASAAAAAIADALGSMEPGSSGKQMADAAADAALAAYDVVADAEDAQRARSQGGGGAGGGGAAAGGTGAADAAAAEGEAGAPERVAVSDALLVQRPTFTAAMVAYVAGLAAAFAANSITGLGQPALVYLVPSMMGALTLAGAARGGRAELDRLWRFTDVASWRPKPAGGGK